jgi:hypothetical protein
MYYYLESGSLKKNRQKIETDHEKWLTWSIDIVDKWPVLDIVWGIYMYAHNYDSPFKRAI